MNPCSDLTDEEHKLFGIVSRYSNRRGVCTLGPTKLAERMRLDHTSTRHLIEGLQDCGLVDLDEGQVFLIDEPCTCPVGALETAVNGVVDSLYTGRETKLLARVTDEEAPLSTTSSRGSRNLFEVPPTSYPSDTPCRAEDGTTVIEGNGYRKRTRAVRRQSSVRGIDVKPIEEWASSDLAKYFGRELRRCHPKRAFAQSVNLPILVKNINAWKRNEGLSNELVKQMIDCFMQRPGLLDRGTAPWLCFVRNAARIQRDAERILEGREREAHRFDRDYWTGANQPQRRVRRGAEYWTGVKA